MICLCVCVCVCARAEKEQWLLAHQKAAALAPGVWLPKVNVQACLKGLWDTSESKEQESEGPFLFWPSAICQLQATDFCSKTHQHASCVHWWPLPDTNILSAILHIKMLFETVYHPALSICGNGTWLRNYKFWTAYDGFQTHLTPRVQDFTSLFEAIVTSSGDTWVVHSISKDGKEFTDLKTKMIGITYNRLNDIAQHWLEINLCKNVVWEMTTKEIHQYLPKNFIKCVKVPLKKTCIGENKSSWKLCKLVLRTNFLVRMAGEWGLMFLHVTLVCGTDSRVPHKSS